VRQKIAARFLVLVSLLTTFACNLLPQQYALLDYTNLETYPLTISHHPVVATLNEEVDFIAYGGVADSSDFTVNIYVNETLIKSCVNESPCKIKAGPFPEYVNTTVSFRAELLKNDCVENCVIKDGLYFFGITGADYSYSTPYIPARVTQDDDNDSPGIDMRQDLLYHMADDYLKAGKNYSLFIDHVYNKIYGVYARKEIIRENLKMINNWVYKKPAQFLPGTCGVLHPDTSSDVTFADTHATLHYSDGTTDESDCSISDRFSAEGWSTKAFLHESSHAMFRVADEYCQPYNTYYFQPDFEPNIWNNEQQCRDEQFDKNRDPEKCHVFCAQNGIDWWGIHDENAYGTGDVTVMMRGRLGDIWGIETAEAVEWYFNNWRAQDELWAD